jgi:hypothetical protein
MQILQVVALLTFYLVEKIRLILQFASSKRVAKPQSLDTLKQVMMKELRLYM